VEVTADELVGLEDRDGALDAGEGLPGKLLDDGAVANRPMMVRISFRNVRLRTDVAESFHHVIDVGPGGISAHHDDRRIVLARHRAPLRPATIAPGYGLTTSLLAVASSS
jgi:hypothetical protein